MPFRRPHFAVVANVQPPERSAATHGTERLPRSESERAQVRSPIVAATNALANAATVLAAQMPKSVSRVSTGTTTPSGQSIEASRLGIRDAQRETPHTDGGDKKTSAVSQSRSTLEGPKEPTSQATSSATRARGTRRYLPREAVDPTDNTKKAEPPSMQRERSNSETPAPAVQAEFTSNKKYLDGGVSRHEATPLVVLKAATARSETGVPLVRGANAGGTMARQATRRTTSEQASTESPELIRSDAKLPTPVNRVSGEHLRRARAAQVSSLPISPGSFHARLLPQDNDVSAKRYSSVPEQKQPTELPLQMKPEESDRSARAKAGRTGGAADAAPLSALSSHAQFDRNGIERKVVAEAGRDTTTDSTAQKNSPKESGRSERVVKLEAAQTAKLERIVVPEFPMAPGPERYASAMPSLSFDRSRADQQQGQRESEVRRDRGRAYNDANSDTQSPEAASRSKAGDPAQSGQQKGTDDNRFLGQGLREAHAQNAPHAPTPTKSHATLNSNEALKIALQQALEQSRRRHVEQDELHLSIPLAEQGTLDIDVRREGDQYAMRIASEPALAALLEDQRYQLAAWLRDQGYQINHLHIEIRQQSNSAHPDSGFEQTSKNSSGGGESDQHEGERSAMQRDLNEGPTAKPVYTGERVWTA
ncbi:MAG: hypothetical protein IPG71_08880 [bacterium]|nr:hypothetical protein [bacterium]